MGIRIWTVSSRATLLARRIQRQIPRMEMILSPAQTQRPNGTGSHRWGQPLLGLSYHLK